LLLFASQLSGHGLDLPVGTRSKSILVLFVKQTTCLLKKKNRRAGIGVSDAEL